MSAELEARGLMVRRGDFTLGPVDLAVERGEYLVLVGPSGAGKTVLVETLLGWHGPAAGSALLEGGPVAALPPAARRFAYLPQDLGILPHLTVRANLTWGLDCRGERPDPELEARLVAVLNLAPLLARSDPATLSRGEQQRLALGRALLTRPRRLLLDEPCAAIDPHRRRELQLLLRSLHREFAMTVVHVTHDREEAFLLGQRIAVLLGGRLHQVATPAGLYAAPADAAVARFVAPENLWPARRPAADAAAVVLDGSGAGLELDGAPEGGGGRIFVGIRPEEVMVLDPDRPLRPQVARNVFAGVVRDVLLLDGRAQVTVSTTAGLDVVSRLAVCAAQDLALRPGAPVRISLKARSLYLVRE